LTLGCCIDDKELLGPPKVASGLCNVNQLVKSVGNKVEQKTKEQKKQHKKSDVIKKSARVVSLNHGQPPVFSVGSSLMIDSDCSKSIATSGVKNYTRKQSFLGGNAISASFL
jgi:hypothetical protein